MNDEASAVTPGQAVFEVRERLRRTIDAEIARAVKHGIVAGAHVGRKMPFEVITDAADAYAQASAARQPQGAPGDEAALTVDDFYAERAERLHRTGERDAARSDLARVKRAVLNPGTHQAKIRKILAIVDPIPDGEPQPAPELGAAMAETRKVADAANVVLDLFAKGSSGWTARISQVNLARAYRAIGRPVPDELRRFL
jgi:hypothetical protein